MIFNRTFQTRARRGGLVSAGAIIDEMVERAADRQRFYRRAAAKGKKRSQPVQDLQLELFPLEENVDAMFERLFPA